MMNERMIELANKANETVGYTFKLEDASKLHELMEMFGLLMIQECVQQCESVGYLAEQTNFGEMSRKTKSTAKGCAQMIKWRFGVEE
jgi:hypothetical protein